MKQNHKIALKGASGWGPLAELSGGTLSPVGGGGSRLRLDQDPGWIRIPGHLSSQDCLSGCQFPSLRNAQHVHATTMCNLRLYTNENNKSSGDKSNRRKEICHETFSQGIRSSCEGCQTDRSTRKPSTLASVKKEY